MQNITKKLVKACFNDLKKEGKTLIGYEGIKNVYQWFSYNTDHPHARWTFDNYACNRDADEFSDRNAKEMAQKFAYLVATNMDLGSEGVFDNDLKSKILA